jgi:cytochrome c oxidase accessory protein FixG
MLVFLALPWITSDGKQLLLLDVARREFFFFGLHFRSHDAPLLIFLFLAFLFLLGFVTAIWGRLWCGWACPQTVFTEFLFRKIERWIEGPPRDRKELDQAPHTGDKLLKRSLKWSAFTVVSLLFTHSFLAYFVGSRELLQMISGSPAQNWPSFLVIFFTTSIVLFDFGWFREQFCIIACPYGRFQSVMLDSRSLVVGYDPRRGEPRRGSVPEDSKQGDCVNCYRCVQVCPTGIDIRRGLQMECITCTACIDACDEVMTKTKRPLGLISYTTLAQLSGRPRKRFGAKAISFGVLLLVAIAGLGLTLSQKDFLDVTILRASGAPYEIVQQGTSSLVVNHFRIDLSNQTGGEISVNFSLADAEKASLIFPQNPLNLSVNANQRADFFVRFPPGILINGSKKVILEVQFKEQKREMELSLVGPNA